MATYYWDLDANVVSLVRGANQQASVSAKRGDAPLTLVPIQGGVPVVSPGSAPVGVCMRDPANLKGGYLAGPVVLTAGASAAAGYSGTLSTDTDAVRTAVHANPADPLPEDESYPVEIAFYYVPTGGNPIESPSVPWIIVAPDYRPGDPPAALAEQYPTAAVVTETVALAASALQPDNVGTTAGKLVALDGTGKLPAVDGSQLTNLPASGSAAGLFPGLTNMLLVGYQFGDVYYTQVTGVTGSGGSPSAQATFVAGGSLATLRYTQFASAFTTEFYGAVAVVDGTAVTGDIGPAFYLDYVSILEVHNFPAAVGLAFQRSSQPSNLNSLSISGCPLVTNIGASSAFASSISVGACIQGVASFAQASGIHGGVLDVTNNPDIPTDNATTAALATLSGLGWSVASGQSG